MVIELPVAGECFEKVFWDFFAPEFYFICTNRMCHDNCYVFCYFFIRCRHAPSPSRVGTKEGLLRPLFPYSMLSCAWKTSFLRLSFTSYIRSYLRTKNDQNRQDFGLVPNTSSPPARSSQAHFAFKEWSGGGGGLPCSSSFSGLLVSMVTLPSMLPYLPL